MYLNAFIISIFSDISKIQALVPVLAALQFQKVMFLMALLGVFVSSQLRKRVLLFFASAHGKALLLFSLWIMLSIPLSVYPGSSFKFLAEHYWKFVLFYCLIVAYGSSRDSLGKMVWAVIFAVSIFAIAAVGGEGSSRFSLIEAYDANENAMLFVIAIPLVFWKIVELKGWKSLFMVGIFILLVVGIMETKSRGGFLGLTVVTLVSLFQYKKFRKIGILRIVAVLALLLMVMYMRGGSEYTERIASIFDQEQNYNYTAEQGRIQVWMRGVDMLLSNPVFGVGANAYIAADGLLYENTGGRFQAAHNSFVQVGAELGFPGLILFCYMIWKSIRYLQAIVSRHSPVNSKASSFLPTTYSFIGAWVGYLVCGAFLSAAYTSVFYLLLGLSYALYNHVILLPALQEEKSGLLQQSNLYDTAPAVKRA